MRQSKQTRKVEPFTYLHQGTTVQGDLTATGRVRVHGTVRGNVEVDGVLEVAEEGVIEGEHVRADEVKVIGLVRANVEAAGKVEIWRQGRLEGNVQAKVLDIEEGAVFIGRSNMADNMAEEPAAPAAEAEDPMEIGTPLQTAPSEA